MPVSLCIVYSTQWKRNEYGPVFLGNETGSFSRSEHMSIYWVLEWEVIQRHFLQSEDWKSTNFPNSPLFFCDYLFHVDYKNYNSMCTMKSPFPVDIHGIYRIFFKYLNLMRSNQKISLRIFLQDFGFVSWICPRQILVITMNCAIIVTRITKHWGTL